jgi:alginate O-acetyltransferase complex protein AlgI
MGIILLVGSLLFFKFFPQLKTLIVSLVSKVSSGSRVTINDLVVPLGISYTVFKCISYLTDIKWMIIQPGSFLNFFCYNSLFSIFMAGPIERFERINPQLTKEARIDATLVNHGYSRIVQGVFKKYVIVNWLYLTIISGVNYQTSVWAFLVYALAYMIYLYIDFSSYSDIAIGSSALLGISIRENFNNPYAASNIKEFWLRWHISLSEWIRDYLFFPLSSLNKRKLWLLLFVPLIAMGVCGVWHGVGWKYLIWGIAHGLMIALYQFVGKKYEKSEFGSGFIGRLVGTAVFLSFILFSWYFFFPSGKTLSGSFPGVVTTLKVGGLFLAVLTISYINKTAPTRVLRLLELFHRYPILTHTVLLAITIMIGSFNTDNKFVYVDF